MFSRIKEQHRSVTSPIPHWPIPEFDDLMMKRDYIGARTLLEVRYKRTFLI